MTSEKKMKIEIHIPCSILIATALLSFFSADCSMIDFPVVVGMFELSTIPEMKSLELLLDQMTKYRGRLSSG